MFFEVLLFINYHSLQLIKMSLTQFAMVKELAFLVKDNLPSKHLVLSMEEALVNFLQDDKSTDGILDLEPMDSYSRLLLHRLADIFGFAHESVGEGGDRHVILERCPETSIPSILVSDLMWEYGEPQSVTTSRQLLRRKEAPTVLNTKSPPLQQSLKEREAAYLAARERIFSTDSKAEVEPVGQKPRSVPVVAQRMVAHALGQKVKIRDQDNFISDGKTYEQRTNKINIQDNDKGTPNASSEANQGVTLLSSRSNYSFDKAKKNYEKSSSSSRSQKVAPKETVEKSCNGVSIPQNGRSKKSENKEYLKEEHLGAAKRMFAHALGLHSAKDGFNLKSSEKKQVKSE